MREEEFYLTGDDREKVGRALEQVANTPAGRIYRKQRPVRGGGGVVAYSGDFAVSTLTTTTCSLAAGRFEAGTLIVSVPTTELTIPSELAATDGIAYVYVESYAERILGSWTVVTTPRIGSSFPVLELRDIEGLDKWVYPFTCAEITVTAGVFGAVKQQQYGTHKAAGVLV